MVPREKRGSIVDRHEGTTGKDRRGRRLDLSCRLFFFGDDDFEAEGTLMDISTSGCRASSTVRVQRGMILKLSVFLPDHQWLLRVEEAMVQWLDDYRTIHERQIGEQGIPSLGSSVVSLPAQMIYFMAREVKV